METPTKINIFGSDNPQSDLYNLYIEFLSRLAQVIPNKKDHLEQLINDLDEVKVLEIGKKYMEAVNSKEKLMRYLVIRKSKMFHKDNKVPVIKGLNLKKVIDKAPENIAEEIWNYLYQIYFLCASEEDNEFVQELWEEMNNLGQFRQKEKDDSMKGMIMNMAKEIENKGGSQNMGDMFSAAQKISAKYQEKLMSGEMGIDDVLGSLLGMLDEATDDNDPEAAETTQNLKKLIGESRDENGHLNPQVLMENMMNSAEEMGINPQDMMSKMMGGAGGLGNMFGGGGDGEDTSNLPDLPLTLEQMEEMERFYSQMAEQQEDNNLEGDLENVINQMPQMQFTPEQMTEMANFMNSQLAPNMDNDHEDQNSEDRDNDDGSNSPNMMVEDVD